MANYGEESRSFTYDVFLSFRGEDTRHTFIKDLRAQLRRKGIDAFIDDNDNDMKIGEAISPALSNAIKQSKISIVVLSENYATSTWCLRELDQIISQKKENNKRVVFPIFYLVDPSDVQDQKKSFGKAIKDHEDNGKNSEEVQKWKSALSYIGGLEGPHITTTEYENFIEEIVKKVRADKVRKPLPVSKDLVGFEHRIEEVESLLELKPYDDTVLMMCIWGLGGVGKTELAKALYRKIVHQFDTACFLESVREKSGKNNGLEVLQKTLLLEMREEFESKSGDASQRIDEIKCKLSKKKVLLVLDDINDIYQLNNLAGRCDWFGSGSRVIITTRHKDLLDGHDGVQKIYQVTELNDEHSLKLFCQNAFKESLPKPGYEDMSSRAVGYAGGLPLALKVIGSNLASQQSLEAWESALKVYESIPHSKIQDKLKVSYDGLEDSAKHVFLDIACFFKGERTEYVEKLLEEFDATHNFEVLVNKSLITVEDSCLKMHDLLQDMGQEIVRREEPIPSKRSRLWFYEDVLEVLNEDYGSDAIQGIMLDPPKREEVNWSGTAFEKMKNLRILIIRNTSFTSGPKHMPNSLRLLDWEEYPSRSFPPNFHPTKIIVFNLCRSNLTLEEPFKEFSSLINMNFSWSQSITVIPDVSKVPNLRELRLDNCKKLFQVHESVGFLERLTHLSVSGCSELIHFPQSIFLPSLEVLDLNLCVKLEHFPDIVNDMNKPLKIDMITTAIKELPDSIGKLTGLVSIEITGSNELRYLPSSLFMLPNVVAFKIGGCSHLQESFKRFLEGHSIASDSSALTTLSFVKGGLSDNDLCTILNCFPKLKELIASENEFVSLPKCIKESIHLTSLDLSGCQMLQEIPESTNLRILDVHGCLNLRHISELPSTIQKVDARYCKSLTTKTLTMLWSQVSKEIRELDPKEVRKLEIVMPRTEIPKWFDFRGNGGNPHFWIGKKFPIFALALEFQKVKGVEVGFRRQLVELDLFINSQRVPRKGYHSFRTAPNHVLVCDLRLLFSDEQWQGLDAFLQRDWNLVQVSYHSTMMLSCWGVFVYKQGNNMEDVTFRCPDPKYSVIPIISHPVVPPTDSKLERWRKEIDSLALDETFEGTLLEFQESKDGVIYADNKFAVDQMHNLLGTLKKMSEDAKDVLDGKALSDKSNLAWVLDTMEKHEPSNNDVGEASTSGHPHNPDGNDALIDSFCEITSSPREQAVFFLESHNFDLNAAVSTFFDSINNINNAIPSNNDVGEASTSGSRERGIRTLHDLKRHRSDSDSESDEPPEYYTGGQKSGMLVQDPTKGGNNVDDDFDQARQSAVDAPPENSSRSKSFTGTARLLSGETLPSAPQPVDSITHTITFWRNGFSVDDGPLRRLNDPRNAPFLESIRRSECPKELEPRDRRTSVHCNLTKRDENYPEPVKPRHLPFRGIGRTLVSSSSSSEAAGESTQTTTGASPNTAPVPAMGLVVDESQPVTSIQLRLADGTRMVSRFNHHHTIRDVRAFIDASRPGGVRSYQLQTMGFPPKQLADLDQTIEQAGIANSVIIQRL